jgi:hypothetical protein
MNDHRTNHARGLHPDDDVVYQSARGSYKPRAFCVSLLHSDFDLPADAPRAIPLHRFSTFMHEVSHLVQDRATYRGIVDFQNLWDQVSAARTYIDRVGPQVLLPIVDARAERHRLHPDMLWATEIERLRTKAEPREEWTDDERFWAFQNYRVQIHRMPLAGRTVDMPVVFVDLINNEDGEPYTHLLGAWEIKEAYASAVGLLHGGTLRQPGTSGFEYLVVERILAYYFGNISPAQTVAICHWALQDLAPACKLFHLIEILQEHDHVLPPAQEMYNLCRDDARRLGFVDHCRESLRILEDTEQEYTARDHVGIARLFRWFRWHANHLLYLQLDEHQQFPLDTFLCRDSRLLSDADRSQQMEEFFREVQVPLAFWPDGTGHDINGDGESRFAAFLNRCVVSLLNRVWTGRSKRWRCPVYRACRETLRDQHNCVRYPWKKGRGTGQTCPYGAAARVLGITDGTSLLYEPFELTGVEHERAQVAAYFLALDRGGGILPPYDHERAVEDFCRAADRIIAQSEAELGDV